MNEITWVTLEEANEAFNELLDEIYPKWEFGDVTYYPSQILEAVDPQHYEIALDEHLTFMAEEMNQFVKGVTDPEDYK
jgi:hypothetical protein|tara:strand:+ start:2110 stop:2343 length:234 start_codon:yes stop_codon:yes gene_type:complete